MYFLQPVSISAIDQGASNQVRDLQHFFLFHSARRDGWRANAYATWLKDWVGVEGNAVLVYRDAGLVENFLGFFSVNYLWAKIDEHQMIIGAAGDDAITMLGQAGCQRFGI